MKRGLNEWCLYWELSFCRLFDDEINGLRKWFYEF